MPISIDGLRCEYSDSGSGLPIVFIPGFAGSKEWFTYQASGLDRYRVISYDVRRARRRIDYSLDLLVDDLVKFLNALRLPEVVVAGHEFGALIAMSFAISHPDRCTALVLSSAAPSFSKLSEEEILSYLAPGKMEFESFFTRLRKKIFGKTIRQDDELEPPAYLARHNADIDPPTLAARLAIMRQSDLTEQIAEIGAPTLIMTGSRERPQILAGSQVLDERIASATLEVTEDADHFFFYTRHDLFNATLDDYLSRHLAEF